MVSFRCVFFFIPIVSGTSFYFSAPLPNNTGIGHYYSNFIADIDPVKLAAECGFVIENNGTISDDCTMNLCDGSQTCAGRGTSPVRTDALTCIDTLYSNTFCPSGSVQTVVLALSIVPIVLCFLCVLCYGIDHATSHRLRHYLKRTISEHAKKRFTRKCHRRNSDIDEHLTTLPPPLRNIVIEYECGFAKDDCCHEEEQVPLV